MAAAADLHALYCATACTARTDLESEFDTAPANPALTTNRMRPASARRLPARRVLGSSRYDDDGDGALCFDEFVALVRALASTLPAKGRRRRRRGASRRGAPSVARAVVARGVGRRAARVRAGRRRRRARAWVGRRARFGSPRAAARPTPSGSRPRSTALAYGALHARPPRARAAARPGVHRARRSVRGERRPRRRRRRGARPRGTAARCAPSSSPPPPPPPVGGGGSRRRAAAAVIAADAEGACRADGGRAWPRRRGGKSAWPGAARRRSTTPRARPRAPATRRPRRSARTRTSARSRSIRACCGSVASEHDRRRGQRRAGATPRVCGLIPPTAARSRPSSGRARGRALRELRAGIAAGSAASAAAVRNRRPLRAVAAPARARPSVRAGRRRRDLVRARAARAAAAAAAVRADAEAGAFGADAAAAAATLAIAPGDTGGAAGAGSPVDACRDPRASAGSRRAQARLGPSSARAARRAADAEPTWVRRPRAARCMRRLDRRPDGRHAASSSATGRTATARFSRRSRRARAWLALRDDGVGGAPPGASLSPAQH